MAVEKKFLAVPAQLLTVDGDQYGKFEVADATLYKVKQCLMLNSNTQPPIMVQINRILSDTEIEVGPVKGQISAREDVSAYTVADGAFIVANEQPRPTIDMADVISAVFSEEPTVALRTILVDKLGNPYTAEGGLPLSFPPESKLTCPDGTEILNTRIMNDAFTKPWDDIEVTIERPDGQPQEIITRKDGVDQQRGTLTYFTSGNFRRLIVTDI